MKDGAYFARVCEGNALSVYVDEDAIRDSQTRRIFEARDAEKAAAEQRDADQKKASAKISARQARRMRTAVADCGKMLAAAAMVYAGYRFGATAAVICITALLTAAAYRAVLCITGRSGK